MPIISVKILKVSEDSNSVKYALGNPPGRIIAYANISKTDGAIDFNDIIDDKYKKHLLPFVLKQLEKVYNFGEYPEKEYFNS